MFTIPAAAIMEIVGLHAAMPGFAAVLEPGAAEVDAATGEVKVDLKPNMQSIAQSHAQNNAGVNKGFAQEAAQSLQQKGGKAFDSVLSKSGQQQTVERVMSKTPFGFRPNYSQLNQQPAPNPKNMVMQNVQKRQFDAVRRRIDAALNAKKTVKLDPAGLPQPVLEKMAEEAVVSGDLTRAAQLGKQLPKNAIQQKLGMAPKKRQWAGLISEWVPTGFITD